MANHLTATEARAQAARTARRRNRQMHVVPGVPIFQRSGSTRDFCFSRSFRGDRHKQRQAPWRRFQTGMRFARCSTGLPLIAGSVRLVRSPARAPEASRGPLTGAAASRSSALGDLAPRPESTLALGFQLTGHLAPCWPDLDPVASRDPRLNRW